MHSVSKSIHGSLQYASPGKNKNKKERPYISRISPGAPLRPIGTTFGLHVRLADVINCAKVYRYRLMGLHSVRGRILTIPIGLLGTNVPAVILLCSL